MKIKPERLLLRLIFLKDHDKEVYSFVVSISFLNGVLFGISLISLILSLINEYGSN